MKTKTEQEWDIILTKDFLLREYVINHKNITDISKEQKCGTLKITQKLKQFGITRKRVAYNRRLDVPDKLKRMGFTIISEYKGNKTKHLIRCYCGNKFETIPYKILSGHTKSCGCRYNQIHSHSWKGYEQIGGKQFKHIAYGAKRRNIVFDITIKQVWELYLSQNRRCALTGLELTWDSKTGYGTASVDRIDNNKGYIVGNIQIIHKDVNMMKRHHSQDYFIYLCSLIGKNKYNEEFLEWERVNLCKLIN